MPTRRGFEPIILKAHLHEGIPVLVGLKRASLQEDDARLGEPRDIGRDRKVLLGRTERVSTLTDIGTAIFRHAMAFEQRIMSWPACISTISCPLRNL